MHYIGYKISLFYATSISFKSYDSNFPISVQGCPNNAKPFEETSKMEAVIWDRSLENGLWFWHFVKNLKWILSFKGLGSFSFQLLSGTILAPKSQYSFATTKKMESATLVCFEDCYCSYKA